MRYLNAVVIQLSYTLKFLANIVYLNFINKILSSKMQQCYVIVKRIDLQLGKMRYICENYEYLDKLCAELD